MHLSLLMIGKAEKRDYRQNAAKCKEGSQNRLR